MEGPALLLGVSVRAEVYLADHDVVRVESEVEIPRVQDRPRRNPGRDQEKHGECDLASDEQAPAPGVSRAAARRLLERRRHGSARCLERRDEAEGQTCYRGDPHGDGQHTRFRRQIERDVEADGK